MECYLKLLQEDHDRVEGVTEFTPEALPPLSATEEANNQLAVETLAKEFAWIAEMPTDGPLPKRPAKLLISRVDVQLYLRGKHN